MPHGIGIYLTGCWAVKGYIQPLVFNDPFPQRFYQLNDGWIRWIKQPLLLLVPVCQYPCCLVELFRTIFIICITNVQDRAVANPSFCIAVALHQTVVSIQLLFVFVISQAELEIHYLQNCGNQQYKTTTKMSLQTKRRPYTRVELTSPIPPYE